METKLTPDEARAVQEAVAQNLALNFQTNIAEDGSCAVLVIQQAAMTVQIMLPPQALKPLSDRLRACDEKIRSMVVQPGAKGMRPVGGNGQ